MPRASGSPTPSRPNPAARRRDVGLVLAGQAAGRPARAGARRWSRCSRRTLDDAGVEATALGRAPAGRRLRAHPAARHAGAPRAGRARRSCRRSRAPWSRGGRCSSSPAGSSPARAESAPGGGGSRTAGAAPGARGLDPRATAGGPGCTTAACRPAVCRPAVCPTGGVPTGGVPTGGRGLGATPLLPGLAAARRALHRRPRPSVPARPTSPPPAARTGGARRDRRGSPTRRSRPGSTRATAPVPPSQGAAHPGTRRPSRRGARRPRRPDHAHRPPAHPRLACPGARRDPRGRSHTLVTAPPGGGRDRGGDRGRRGPGTAPSPGCAGGGGGSATAAPPTVVFGVLARLRAPGGLAPRRHRRRRPARPAIGSHRPAAGPEPHRRAGEPTDLAGPPERAGPSCSRGSRPPAAPAAGCPTCSRTPAFGGRAGGDLPAGGGSGHDGRVGGGAHGDDAAVRRMPARRSGDRDAVIAACARVVSTLRSPP